MKKSETGLKDALKKQAEREKHKKSGLVMTKWPVADKKEYKKLAEGADEYHAEFVKPSSHEVLKYQGVSAHLKSQIELGSVSPKKRAENRKQRSRF